MPLSAHTRLGPVTLRVADLDAMTAFYERAIGLRVLERSGGLARLGADGEALVELAGDPDAPPSPRPATGLFHQAFLVGDRRELARALKRVADAGWRFTGFSDHLVSEALYLDDPEGNGIEIYRDRPREQWRTTASGEIEMATIALDVDSVLAELPDDEDPGMSPRTVMGHVHLRVSDVPASEAFYSGLLGFDVTVRGYPGALFVSAGGYHHHLGLNIWGSAGAAAPPEGARGLVRYEVVLDDADLAALRSRLEASGAEVAAGDGGALARDPSGHAVLLRGL